MEIVVINKELESIQKVYNIELEINEKTVEISISDTDNDDLGHTAVEWELLNSSEELDENEHDIIDDWVAQYKYEDK